MLLLWLLEKAIVAMAAAQQAATATAAAAALPAFGCRVPVTLMHLAGFSVHH
jgi:hypothetical protein